MPDLERSAQGAIRAPYRSPDERERAFDEKAAALGLEAEQIGTSVQGRPIRGLRAPTTGDVPRDDSGDVADTPAVLVMANIHGVEYIAAEVALAFLDALAEPSDALAAIRDRCDVWVVPCLNPDTYAATWEAGGIGRLDQLRPNANGVDLNRNFPKPAAQKPVWFSFGGWRTGSDDPDNAFYRGTHPLSEPEAQAADELFRRADFRASVSLHSTMGTLIQPCVQSRADYRTYKSLCHTFRAAQPEHRYRRMANKALDRYTGEQEDHQHAVFGTWSLCVEHWPLTTSTGRFFGRTPLFQRFNPPDPARWAANDIPGIVAFFGAALELDRPEDHRAWLAREETQ